MPASGVTFQVPLEVLLYWHSTLKGMAINPSTEGQVGKERYREICQSVLQIESLFDAAEAASAPIEDLQDPDGQRSQPTQIYYFPGAEPKN